jgi:Trypsin
MIPWALLLSRRSHLFTAAAATVDRTRRKLIINGQDAAPGRYPYMVTLDDYGGGALIAPDMILTAGHCQPSRPHRTHPRIGTYSLDEPARNGTTSDVWTTIHSMYRHPDWVQVGEDEFINDFVLLKLVEPDFTHPVVRINRHEAYPPPDATVLALGLGDVDPYRDIRPDVLQQVNLTVIDNDICSQAHRVSSIRRRQGKRYFRHHPHETYHNRIFPSHLCTGYPADHNSRDSCNYDSGSPIIVPDQEANTQGTCYFRNITSSNATDAVTSSTAIPITYSSDVLVALVSWGMQCADRDFPGTFKTCCIVVTSYIRF